MLRKLAAEADARPEAPPASSGDLAGRRARVQTLLADMKSWPTETELLQRALDTLWDAQATREDGVAALRLVQELVEQVDVANGALCIV